MNNKPYIFCNSDKNLHDISSALEKVGLSLVSKIETDQVERWVLFCPWKAEDKISLSWKRTYWPDGIKLVDDMLELSINGQILGNVDIDFLRKQKFDKSLSAVIINEITKIASAYTGKSIQNTLNVD